MKSDNQNDSLFIYLSYNYIKISIVEYFWLPTACLPLDKNIRKCQDCGVGIGIATN